MSSLEIASKIHPPLQQPGWSTELRNSKSFFTKLNSATTVQKKKKKVPAIDHFNLPTLRICQQQLNHILEYNSKSIRDRCRGHDA